MSEEKNNIKSAVLKMSLRAESGYSVKQESEISPNQWGDIQRVIEGNLSSKSMSEAVSEVVELLGSGGAPNLEWIKNRLSETLSKSHE